MDERIIKLNAKFKEFEKKIAELRRRQLAAVDAFGKRAVEQRIKELREKHGGYGDIQSERDN